MRPEYSTGISHPEKLTILAPSPRWFAFKEVFFKELGDVSTGLLALSRTREVSLLSRAPLRGQRRGDGRSALTAKELAQGDV